MRISLAYNLRREEVPEQAEFLSTEQMEELFDALSDLGHRVIPVEVTGPLEEAADQIIGTDRGEFPMSPVVHHAAESAVYCRCSRNPIRRSP